MLRGLIAIMAVGASSALAAPLVPRIDSYDINFGAWEAGPDGPESSYFTNGRFPDILLYTFTNPFNHEATALWPDWPSGDPLPVFGKDGIFGGEFLLALRFDAEDAMPPHLSVSITGTGARDGAGLKGVDLAIRGRLGSPTAPMETLLAIDVQDASMYGHAFRNTYVLEMAGTIVHAPDDYQHMIGESGVARGFIDFAENPLFPVNYDPQNPFPVEEYVTAYSGEAGQGTPTPEPSTFGLLLLGIVCVVRRR